MTPESPASTTTTSEFTFPELDVRDCLYLQELQNLHGRERVLGWLRGKTAIPLQYKFEDDFDEDAYFEAMADHYVERRETE